jgi:hypothetical protein
MSLLAEMVATAEEVRLSVCGGPGDEVLDELQDNLNQIAALQAAQVRLLARFAALRPGGRGRVYSVFAADEVSAALRWTRARAEGKLREALAMTREVPEVLDALERGEVDEFTASVVTEAVAALPADKAHQVTAHVLARAGTRNISELRRVLRRAILKADPDGAEQRRAVAREDRRVEFTPQDHGMASLWALLPAQQALTIHRRLDAFAREQAPGDPRTLDQRRADAFADLMMNPAHGAVTTHLQLTVPATALTDTGHTTSRNAPGGDATQTAELAGYGTITTAHARELAAPGTTGDLILRRYITNPISGGVIDRDGRSYRPSPALADLVRTRDRYCVFPGCSHPATSCDIDHRVPYPKGATTADNLNCLCRHHHRMKHETGWILRKHRNGYVWINPGGIEYIKETEPIVEPLLPPEPGVVEEDDPPF